MFLSIISLCGLNVLFFSLHKIPPTIYFFINNNTFWVFNYIQYQTWNFFTQRINLKTKIIFTFFNFERKTSFSSTTTLPTLSKKNTQKSQRSKKLTYGDVCLGTTLNLGADGSAFLIGSAAKSNNKHWLIYLDTYLIEMLPGLQQCSVSSVAHLSVHSPLLLYDG